jgi:transposase
VLLAPTLEAASTRGLLAEVETLWLDKGYDSKATRDLVATHGITDAIIAKQRRVGEPKPQPGQKKLKMGLRWPVERTNSWLTNFGQLRRNTDRRSIHRLAQFSLAIACLLTAKLIDWRNRWSREMTPIR